MARYNKQITSKLLTLQDGQCLKRTEPCRAKTLHFVYISKLLQTRTDQLVVVVRMSVTVSLTGGGGGGGGALLLEPGASPLSP